MINLSQLIRKTTPNSTLMQKRRLVLNGSYFQKW
nr:MAG TPA: hypothetical protein [Caudoviricetes sp.]